jgi:hypothetical protein
MEPQLVVDDKNNLLEVRPPKEKQSSIVRITARIISYVFHPIFIPVYLAGFIVKTEAHLFTSLTDFGKAIFIIRFGTIYIMFPLISVLLMKGLGFISSIHLKTQRDRIIPYIVCMVYYWWMWWVLHNQVDLFPKECIILSLAIFLASVGGLMANIRMKVSMHAMAAGIMISFVMLLGLSQYINFGAHISIAILLGGIICTARFIDSDHTAKEIYVGLLIGVLSFVLALKFA